MKRLVIVHGYTGSPAENWFPWLKQQMEEEGFEVIVPELPNPNAPVLEEWLGKLKQDVGGVDEDTYFIGHSLGCSTILRYLEAQDDECRSGGVVLVSGFAEPIHFTELDGFTAGEWNYEKIKKLAGQIIIINSDNDPHVPLQMAKNIMNNFSAELIVMHDAGHINVKDGYLELPEAVDALHKLMQ